MASPELKQLTDQLRAVRAAAPPGPPDLTVRLADFEAEEPPVPADVASASRARAN